MGLVGLGSGNLAEGGQDTEDLKAVEQLMRAQGQKGSPQEWLKGYRAEREAVFTKRLKPISEAEAKEKGIDKIAVRSRMNLEPKHDGRKKCRWLVQGFREPASWDRVGTDSPVASLTAIRTLVFKKGKVGDILSSIDVSTAFLQANAYDESEEPRYIYYRPYKGAPKEYYLLTGPLYGSRTSPMIWYHTIRDWIVS